MREGSAIVILGIDPGCRVSGYGVLKKETSQCIILLDYGYLHMASSKPLSMRIGIFYDFFIQKINQWNVTDIALETPFLGKNAQNFLKLGYLRGIVYLLSSKNDLTLHEFSPREVKQSITGFGGASKEQVARVVSQLFSRLEANQKADVTDALAITLCGIWRNKNSYLG